jgi:hypothetical protein
MLYRKDRDEFSEWHFREDCPLWPEVNYIEVRAPILDECERLCLECAQLESSIHEHLGSRYFLQGLAYSLYPKVHKQKTQKTH